MQSLRLASRNLFRNTRRTLLTSLLISTSLIVIILTDGLVLGMLDLMTGSLTKTIAGEAQVHRRGFLENFDADRYIPDPAASYEILDASEAVAAWAPRVIAGGMVTSTYNVGGGLIYGIDAEREPAVSLVSDAITDGRFLSGEARELLLGEPMLELLEVRIGDRIVITVSEPDSGEIAQELFRVSGVFLTGQPELDESFVFINLKAAQSLLAIGDGVHEIAWQFTNPEDGKRRDHPLLAELTDEQQEALIWLDFFPAIGAMIEMTNLSTAIVGVILFILAALGVINSMFMSIYERLYEFGVIRAIGTRPGQVMQLVMLEALVLGMMSCAVGIIVGYLLNAYFASNGIPMGEMEVTGIVLDGNIYTALSVSQFTLFPALVVLLTLIAAIYPAWYAARISPAHALHKSL